MRDQISSGEDLYTPGKELLGKIKSKINAMGIDANLITEHSPALKIDDLKLA